MFQRAVNVILVTVKLQHAIVNTNGISFFSNDPQQHLKHLEKVMRMLKHPEMTI